MMVGRNVLAEVAGWLFGLLGFAVAMYGVYVGTTDGSIPLTLGLLAGGLLVSLFGITVAITSRENRLSGTLAERIRAKNGDNVPED